MNWNFKDLGSGGKELGSTSRRQDGIWCPWRDGGESFMSLNGAGKHIFEGSSCTLYKGCQGQIMLGNQSWRTCWHSLLTDSSLCKYPWKVTRNSLGSLSDDPNLTITEARIH